MVRTRQDKTWHRRGITLLWDADSLWEIASPKESVDIRGFFDLVDAWPEDLPSADGDALVVTGLEGILDALDHADAVQWLEKELRPAMLSFQEEYEGQAGLVMWLPSGRKRMSMERASEHYFWTANSKKLMLGQYLWGGAEADVERLMDGGSSSSDYDGQAWCGLFHPRIS
jgi:hypothetical protein